MGKDFWLKRWETGETGWHQNHAEPALMRFAPATTPSQVLVPLCGKSLDLKWLIDFGYEVTGVELSPLAIESFFQEHKITFTKSELKVENSQPITLYQGPKIKIFCGDFFEIPLQHFGKIDWVYDRAALIALPPKKRSLYIHKIKEILSLNTPTFAQEILQILMERSPLDENGPPYCVTVDELKKHYEDRFNIEVLTRDEVAQNIYQSVVKLKQK